jgi:hypothetical protein
MTESGTGNPTPATEYFDPALYLSTIA